MVDPNADPFLDEIQKGGDVTKEHQKRQKAIDNRMAGAPQKSTIASVVSADDALVDIPTDRLRMALLALSNVLAAMPKAGLSAAHMVGITHAESGPNTAVLTPMVDGFRKQVRKQHGDGIMLMIYVTDEGKKDG